MMSDFTALFTLGCFMVIGFCVYMFPTTIAILRQHKNWMAIGVFNFCLGFTGLGYILALVWSLTATE